MALKATSVEALTTKKALLKDIKPYTVDVLETSTTTKSSTYGIKTSTFKPIIPKRPVRPVMPLGGNYSTYNEKVKVWNDWQIKYNSSRDLLDYAKSIYVDGSKVVDGKTEVKEVTLDDEVTVSTVDSMDATVKGFDFMPLVWVAVGFIIIKKIL